MSNTNAVIAIAMACLFFIAVQIITKRFRAWRESRRLEDDVRAIVREILEKQQEFFVVGDEPMISTKQLIELEFKHLRAYRYAFARFDIALEEAHPSLQEQGYSHVLNHRGNQLGVKNWVDITATVVRIA